MKTKVKRKKKKYMKSIHRLGNNKNHEHDDRENYCIVVRDSVASREAGNGSAVIIA